MSYYSTNYYDSDLVASLIMMAICIILVVAIMFGVNCCSASTWNDGVCPYCEVRYELRGASQGLKYYSCPQCGQEVERY